MSDIYSEDSLKALAIESQRMLLLCQQKKIIVCQNFVDAMISIKYNYPHFAEQADKFIKEMKNYYEVIDWQEGTCADPTKWYEIVEYTIKESYGALFKEILERM